MAKHMPGDFRYDAMTVWGCPCGRRGKYQSIVAHRHGYRGRPACAAGPIFQVDAPSEQPAPPLEPPKPAAVPPIGDPDNPTVFDTEDTAIEGAAQGAESEPDPEEVARLLMQQKRAMDLGSPPPPASPGGPPFGGGFDSNLPPEDWVIRGPDGEVHVSQLRESVSIPVSIRVYYDWARQSGWFQGDGSLSSFVADCLLDYFANVLGKVLVVADREEISVGG